jgi:hypothetical protein
MDILYSTEWDVDVWKEVVVPFLLRAIQNPAWRNQDYKNYQTQLGIIAEVQTVCIPSKRK